MPEKVELILAFDFGLRWIGVAVGQSLTATARPLTTLTAKQGKLQQNELEGLIREWQPTALAVGLPLNMDDSESDMSSRSRRFARYLTKTTKLPTYLVDERLTSRAADATMEGAKNMKDGAKDMAKDAMNKTGEAVEKAGKKMKDAAHGHNHDGHNHDH